MSDRDLILHALNDPQRQAVVNIKGPALILAGAGSGKTKALTHRIAHMMREGIPPWQILAVTFTNKAAGEMKERIKNLLRITAPSPSLPLPPDGGRGMGGGGKLPVMGTFHSICARILRREIEKLGRDRSFVIYDADDQEKLMKGVLKEMHVDEKELKPKAALGYVGRFKCEAIAPKDAMAQATTPRMQSVILAYASYQSALRKANALDFDDLILEAVRLFTELPEVLDRYQETWCYLHVDEYQDTNHAQYLFISLLAQKYRNLCVIGDPDQSIYAFRGADIRNILEFEQEYPDALRIKLEQNYRSTQVVLTAANAVIKANPNRPEKEMWSARKEGPRAIVHEVRDEKREAEEAVLAAEKLKADGLPFNEQVVLYRTNAQSRLFEEACMRRGIPYRIIGGVKFYARREVKDVLAYLHVILNTADTLSLLRILNVPARKIGQTTLGHMQTFAAQNRLSLWGTLQRAEEIATLNEGTQARIRSFVGLIEKYRKLKEGLTVSQLTLRLLEDIGLEKWLKDDPAPHGTEQAGAGLRRAEDDGEGAERWGNVLELISVMRKYDALDPHTSLVSFLEEVSLVSEVDKLNEVRDDALTLMTLHLCKGLEFEHVMVGGCEEGVFPHSSSLFDREQLEEERRLMYVGMTRAKTHLRLFLTRSRMLYGTTLANAPSRFLDDLPDAVTERRSDELLSAFAWATESGVKRATASHLEPYRQHEVEVEFNQDVFRDDTSQERRSLGKGTRVRHPVFGEGKIVAKRGDVVTIQFDDGKRKDFALSIAPLRIIGT